MYKIINCFLHFHSRQLAAMMIKEQAFTVALMGEEIKSKR